ncbi:MAG TPA: biopolymer transporter ExbD [Isosphaeraceae bacterium]|nr:biopolymer transporter ExbD [Isosphaeraceae bacterium]
MRLNKRRRPPSIGFDMTPMIDVVFLLIIFFMTVSQQTILDAPPVELPRLAGSVDQEPTMVTLNILPNDSMLLSGQPIDLPALENRLQRELIAVGGEAQRLIVVLRVDRRCDSTLVNRVVDLLKNLGISRTRIAVEVPNAG